jgi:hypothetical protein
MHYKIRRFYRDDRASHDVKGKGGLTLKQAQTHCRNPRTRKVGRDRTVEWFDGYVKE